ncbi:TIGR03668 family PPOX class F420-dependent oxidoreductase [Streptomyces sp. SID10853]|uniref:TIGR03668 family PPOX class F420-dependent oxidoreductase n=1 Tax=Streptomyces sp. SID10853 TaxID=2706028 RepID=UPI0013C18E87|nr:TIGR03668 family PPOX class F420-dependent oxidoreductase [Streptomyces sp. SID10853]NDZ77871.1 TIGR03668 family PPOX class F420-dependent oxidoreductase [Streptomyces sp. SID10853]
MPRMTAAEAHERFAASRVARLATTDAAGRPHLVPVVFAVTGDTLVMAVDHKPKRSARLQRLANIRASPGVCLLADCYREDWEQLWWARADGQARVLPPAGRSSDAARRTALLVAKYPQQYADRPPAGEVVEVQVTRWTGWRAFSGEQGGERAGEPAGRESR